MNCPKCGNPLRMSKKSPGYALCDTCRKKFRLPDSAPKQEKNEDEEEHYPKYANIPPKHVREKREREMRRAYDELLAIGEEERRSRFSFSGRKNRFSPFSNPSRRVIIFLLLCQRMHSLT